MGTPTGVLASAGMPSPKPPQQHELRARQEPKMRQQHRVLPSLSIIVQVPVPFPMVAGPVGFFKSRKKVSLNSSQVSLMVETVTTFETSPGWNCNGKVPNGLLVLTRL